jgi:hypothetical protein
MSENATVSTGSESQSDNGYMGDAFDDYLEAGIPGDKDQDEEAKPQGNSPEEKPAEGDQQTQPKTEGENPEQKDVFQLAFENANGDLDYEKIMTTSFGDESKFQQLEQNQIQTDENPVTPEQEIEQEKQFRENFTTARTAPLQRAFELLSGGMDPQQALQTAYNEIMEETGNYFKERDNTQFATKREQTLAKIQEEAKEAARESRLTEISRSNALSIVNTLPGNNQDSKVALYNHIMFADDAGGSLLQDAFVDAYPDFQKMPEADLEKAKKSFINKLQADPARLKRHFDRSYRLLAASPANLKRFAQSISRNKEAQVRSNSLAAQKAPQGAVHRPAPSQSGGKWDGYFSSGMPKTRI